jgi:hypothetical protein
MLMLMLMLASDATDADAVSAAPEERELLLQILFNREKALAWTFNKIGKIRPEVTPP